MADSQNQEGWPVGLAAQPDVSADWSISKLLQKPADRTTLNWSPEKSSLNMFLNKDEMNDVLASGAGSQGQPGGVLSGMPRPDYSVGPVAIEPIPLPDRLETAQALLKEPRVQALMATVRAHEGPEYNKLGNGATFGDYSDHPRIKVGKKSHAAGAYQFQPGTWDEIQQAFSLPDFSPASQDIAAVDLLHRTGATDKLLAGDLDGAIFAASNQWSGFPREAATITDSKGRTRGQDVQGHPTFTLDQIRADYLKNSR